MVVNSLAQTVAERNHINGNKRRLPHLKTLFQKKIFMPWRPIKNGSNLLPLIDFGETYTVLPLSKKIKNAIVVACSCSVLAFFEQRKCKLRGS